MRFTVNVPCRGGLKMFRSVIIQVQRWGTTDEKNNNIAIEPAEPAIDPDWEITHTKARFGRINSQV
jgi:hypothetical protein